MRFQAHLRRLVPAAATLLVLAAMPAAAAPRADAPLVVKIHADWCGTCVRLGPIWQDLEARYGSKARLVVLDVTDRAALERSRQQAEALGIADFFAANRARTGTIAILDGRSKQPVAVLKGVLDRAAYDRALHEAGIGSSS